MAEATVFSIKLEGPLEIDCSNCKKISKISEFKIIIPKPKDQITEEDLAEMTIPLRCVHCDDLIAELSGNLTMEDIEKSKKGLLN